MTEHTFQPQGSAWAELLKASAEIRALRYEPKHLKCARTTWSAATNDAPAGLGDHDPIATFTGIPVFIDDELPHGQWEVGAGRYPTEDTEYETVPR